MLIASSRASDNGGTAALVVIARGCKVEAFVFHDTPSSSYDSKAVQPQHRQRVEHVADWHLDSEVLALYVAPIASSDDNSDQDGFLVTSACAHGVGWSWVETNNWTIVNTHFQEIVLNNEVQDRETSSRGSSKFSSQVKLSVDSGSVIYLPHASVQLVTLAHQVSVCFPPYYIPVCQPTFPLIRDSHPSTHSP